MAILAPKRTLILGGGLAAVLILYALGAAKQPDRSQPTANTSQCRVSSTVDGLRIRSAPALSAAVVGKLNRGNETDADKVVQNGFRKLTDNKWVSVDFTQVVNGRNCG